MNHLTPFFFVISSVLILKFSFSLCAENYLIVIFYQFLPFQTLRKSKRNAMKVSLKKLSAARKRAF